MKKKKKKNFNWLPFLSYSKRSRMPLYRRYKEAKIFVFIYPLFHNYLIMCSSFFFEYTFVKQTNTRACFNRHSYHFNLFYSPVLRSKLLLLLLFLFIYCFLLFKINGISFCVCVCGCF